MTDSIMTHIIGGLGSWWIEIRETVLAGIIGAVAMIALVGVVIAIAAI